MYIYIKVKTKYHNSSWWHANTTGILSSAKCIQFLFAVICPNALPSVSTCITRFCELSSTSQII